MPEIAASGGQYVSVKHVQPAITLEDQHAFNTMLWELELSDVVISFPAYRAVIKHAQPLLNRIEPGASEGFGLNDRGKFPIITWNQHPIARLSAKGAKYYAEQRAQGFAVEKILFLASICWDGKAEAEEYKRLREVDTWYTGLFQIILDRKE